MAEKKHQYDPPHRLMDMAGVSINRQTGQDVFRGTREQLVGMGLAPSSMFPGEPGMPLVSVTLWPRGTPRGSSYDIEGRLCITRNPSGLFTAARAVSESERARRLTLERKRLEMGMADGRMRRAPETIANGAEALPVPQNAALLVLAERQTVALLARLRLGDASPKARTTS